jgi:hypothetical protein
LTRLFDAAAAGLGDGIETVNTPSTFGHVVLSGAGVRLLPRTSLHAALHFCHSSPATRLLHTRLMKGKKHSLLHYTNFAVMKVRKARIVARSVEPRWQTPYSICVDCVEEQTPTLTTVSSHWFVSAREDPASRTTMRWYGRFTTSPSWTRPPRRRLFPRRPPARAGRRGR